MITPMVLCLCPRVPSGLRLHFSILMRNASERSGGRPVGRGSAGRVRQQPDPQRPQPDPGGAALRGGGEAEPAQAAQPLPRAPRVRGQPGEIGTAIPADVIAPEQSEPMHLCHMGELCCC